MWKSFLNSYLGLESAPEAVSYRTWECALSHARAKGRDTLVRGTEGFETCSHTVYSVWISFPTAPLSPFPYPSPISHLLVPFTPQTLLLPLSCHIYTQDCMCLYKPRNQRQNIFVFCYWLNSLTWLVISSCIYFPGRDTTLFYTRHAHAHTLKGLESWLSD